AENTLIHCESNELLEDFLVGSVNRERLRAALDQRSIVPEPFCREKQRHNRQRTLQETPDDFFAFRYENLLRPVPFGAPHGPVGLQFRDVERSDRFDAKHAGSIAGERGKCNHGKVPSSKFQIPNSKREKLAIDLGCGVWSLSGTWSLELKRVRR